MVLVDQVVPSLEFPWLNESDPYPGQNFCVGISLPCPFAFAFHANELSKALPLCPAFFYISFTLRVLPMYEAPSCRPLPVRRKEIDKPDGVAHDRGGHNEG